MNKVKQHVANAKRFRKDNYKPLIEYINWSEITEDYNLKTGDLDYADASPPQQRRHPRRPGPGLLGRRRGSGMRRAPRSRPRRP